VKKQIKWAQSDSFCKKIINFAGELVKYIKITAMKKYNINNKNTERWNEDVQKSVMFYNDWFLNFAPDTYINARKDAINKVESAFQKTECFNSLSIHMLKNAPESITILRLSTTPPLARDRLVGLANISKNLIEKMEEGRFPPK